MNTIALSLSGIVPPLATPLHEGRLDLAGLERLVQHVLAGEVSAIFVLGTTGEGPALSQPLRREVIEETVSLVADRVPVIAGVSDPSLDEAVELACAADKAGARAVAATPPFYMPMSSAAVRRWYELLADRSPVPVLLYNFPSLANITLTADTTAALMQHPNIIGVKDSSGDMDGFAEFCQQRSQREDWRVFIGPEHLLPEAVALGADGGVCGGANVHPRLYVDWYRAAVDDNHEEVARLREQVNAFMAATYGDPITCESVIHGIKRALAEAGICSAETTWPTSTEPVSGAAAGQVDGPSTRR